MGLGRAAADVRAHGEGGEDDAAAAATMRKLRSDLDAMKEILIAKEGELCEAYDVRQERDVLVAMVRALQEREAAAGRGAGPGPAADLKNVAENAAAKLKGLFAKKG